MLFREENLSEALGVFYATVPSMPRHWARLGKSAALLLAEGPTFISLQQRWVGDGRYPRASSLLIASSASFGGSTVIVPVGASSDSSSSLSDSISTSFMESFCGISRVSFLKNDSLIS